MKQLVAEKRDSEKKSITKKIRREGNIPAILYGKKNKAEAITIMGEGFHAFLRQMPEGCLATQQFEITLGKEKKTVLIKDVHYDKTTYNIDHIDMMQVASTDVVTLHIPVTCIGEDRCPGVVQGGQLKRVKRSVKGSLPVKDIPESFVLDVSGLNLGASIRVGDVKVPKSMRVRTDKNQVLVVVSK